MSELAAAVVGTGFIGPIHVEALRRAGVDVIGVLGSTAEKSSAAARRLGVQKAYTTFDELLADRDVHVVHLPTPNRFHFDQASATLAAGKHVLCEKPLAMNSRESAILVRLAQESGRVAGVCYNVRFYPLCLEAAERVRRGDIGQLYHATGSYAQDWLLEETDFNWRVLGDEGGPLRAVADIGTHWLDLIQFISGREIDEVFADLKTVLPRRRRRKGNLDTFTGSSSATAEGEPVEISNEDYGCVMFRMGGARGVLWVSQVSAGRKNCLRFELAGSRRSLAWNSEQPCELWIGRRDGPNESLLRDPSLLSPSAAQHADYPGGHNEGFPDTFKQLFRAFYDYIRAGDFSAPATFPTFADGHREILLCEAILKSHQQQRWVRP